MIDGKKKIIEYAMLALIFASVIWSVFAGFRISRFQLILIVIGTIILLAGCILMDWTKWVLAVYGVGGVIFWLAAKPELINGFRIISNKMTDAINQSMDLGFYYYVSVNLDHSRRDSVLAVLFFFLAAGFLIGLLRYKPVLLFFVTGVFECGALTVAPYGISSAFFIFLGAWMAYFGLRKNKICFGFGIAVFFILAAIPLYFYDQVKMPGDTWVKREALIEVRNLTQGGDYSAAGGIGNGQIGNTGEVSPDGTNLFQVYAQEKGTLYLKAYTSGDYKDGVWTSNKKDPLIYGGETAAELPFLFADLKIDEFIIPGTNFRNDQDLSIHYQKKQDEYLLVPYFCEINGVEGIISGDGNVLRNGRKGDYQIHYYPMKDPEKLLALNESVSEAAVPKEEETPLEENYFRAMKEYGSYIEETYLDIPKDVKKYLEEEGPGLRKDDSLSETAKKIKKYLKENYSYTYRPGLTPEGKDPVLYFLSDRKKGFCTQYASAAVFLFREAKIPARYVEGYKIRSSQWNRGMAQVTDYDAHAWAEVYVKNVGWVPVDVSGQTSGALGYQRVSKEEKERNVNQNSQKILTSVKRILFFSAGLGIFGFLVIVIKMLRKKKQWESFDNREKILEYKRLMTKYDKTWEESSKSGEIADRTVFEIIRKAEYSQNEIEDYEINLVKRHLNILKRKNRNITKILTRLK